MKQPKEIRVEEVRHIFEVSNVALRDLGTPIGVLKHKGVCAARGDVPLQASQPVSNRSVVTPSHQCKGVMLAQHLILKVTKAGKRKMFEPGKNYQITMLEQTPSGDLSQQLINATVLDVDLPLIKVKSLKEMIINTTSPRFVKAVAD